jgi:hypothetical protein
MATDKVQLTVDGEGIQQVDLNEAFTEAAFADDVVKADLLRLASFDGSNVARCIVPYRVAGSNAAMVQPNGATGSVKVFPFTAVVGSRTSPTATPGSALLNWQDVRSSAYVVTDDDATLGHAVSFSANSSGNPRWDLVVLEFQVDQNNANVLRNVRSPGTPLSQAPVPTSVVPSTTQILSIVVQTGTPSANPAVPAPPSDTVTATGTFYLPLAAVYIPNGFGATTTVLTQWIQMRAPIMPLSAALGGVVERAPNQLAATPGSTVQQAWGTGTRPPVARPCTMQGAVRLRFGFDATSSIPLILDQAVLDSSIDWRNREFRATVATWAGGTQFAWATGAASGAIPNVGASVTLMQQGQSYVDDSLAMLGRSLGGGTILQATNANLSTIAAGANSFGLYVSLSDGALRVSYVGTPGPLLVITIEASDSFDNP